MLVRIFQCLGETLADPTNGLDASGLLQEVTHGAARRFRQGRNGLGLIQGVEKILALPLLARSVGEGRENPRKTGAAEVRHAQGPEMAVRKLLNGIERDDVGVLQWRQAEMLGTVARDDFQHYGAVGELSLGGQEDHPAAATTQFFEEPKFTEWLAGAGKSGHCDRLEQMPAFEHGGQWPAPLRKPCEHGPCAHLFAVPFAETDLFVNQLGG